MDLRFNWVVVSTILVNDADSDREDLAISSCSFELKDEVYSTFCPGLFFLYIFNAELSTFKRPLRAESTYKTEEKSSKGNWYLTADSKFGGLQGKSGPQK